MQTPIQIILLCLPLYAESHPNPFVMSAIICRIPSKSFCHVCQCMQNPIQILLPCLTLYAESHQNPIVNLRHLARLLRSCTSHGVLKMANLKGQEPTHSVIPHRTIIQTPGAPTSMNVYV
jgi:hypothetical protein